MVLARLFRVLVVGGGALVAVGCGGDTAVRPTSGNEQQVLPDGGIVAPAPMPGIAKIEGSDISWGTHRGPRGLEVGIMPYGLDKTGHNALLVSFDL